MRPFEILTLILAIGSLIALINYKDRKPFLYTLFGTSLCSILQYFFEGNRWQFMPILYSLPLMYVFHKFQKTHLNIFSKTILIFCLTIGCLLLYTIPVFQLPNPNGAYKIGTETFHWADSTRNELFTPEDSTDYREIIVQTWYPTKNISNKTPEPYLDFIELRTSTMAAAGGLPSFLTGHLKFITSNSFKNTTCIINQAPVLIFSHGITGSRHLHQAMFEFLASRGYIIFAPDHSYDANITVFPNKKTANYRSEITGNPDSVNIRKMQMNTRSSDIIFILNQLKKINSGVINSSLKNKLDLKNIAVGGHSYGGATATTASYIDNRIKACFNLDGWLSPIPKKIILDGIKIPFLFVGRPSWSGSDYPNNYEPLKSLLNNSLEPKYGLILKKTKHLDYTDIPLFSPIIKYVIDVGNLPSSQSIPLLNNLVFQFLEKELAQSDDNNFNKIISNELFIKF